ncbi:integral membrane protein S linking to the trans Golgi network-domain-containing protein [Amylocystis lapponica]|nr:integral membrane protein S linking to the trans Golgi network-domain-containing protein [Amylocystis lapponica]
MAKSTVWDPVLLISQIVSIQTLHYLTLAVLVPPLLTIFAESSSLEYYGGAANVGMVMDWRELAGRPASRATQGDSPWSSFNPVWSGGKQVGSGDVQEGQWDGRVDPIRSWIIAVCWMTASGVDIYYMYTLVRRPRLILDFSLTLIFNHLVLTTYYSKALPTSLFFWAVMAASAALMIIVAEQFCVKREMAEGLTVVPLNEGEDVEMGSLLRRD